MISPERFLALLEEKEMLSPRTVASLREQIANSAEPMTAAAFAKRLIKHGRITQAQAKRLLAEEREIAQPKPAAATAKPKRSDDLGFAPIEGEGEQDKSAKPREAVGDAATTGRQSGGETGCQARSQSGRARRWTRRCCNRGSLWPSRSRSAV